MKRVSIISLVILTVIALPPVVPIRRIMAAGWPLRVPARILSLPKQLLLKNQPLLQGQHQPRFQTMPPCTEMMWWQL
jgi:hypothetical protein